MRKATALAQGRAAGDLVRMAIKTAKTQWRDMVLVCRKCSKKLDGGFGEGGDQKLGKALRRAIGGGKGRKAGVAVIEVGCLDLCPKNAVVVANASRPGEWVVVPRGTPIAGLVERIGLDAPKISEPA